MKRRNGQKKRTVKRSMRGGVIKQIPDGDEEWGGIYDGELNDKDERHGKGIMTYNTGGNMVYVGDWKNDKQDGNGKLTMLNDEATIVSTYEGEFKDNAYHGHGYYNDSKISYSGEFANDRRNGFGFITTKCIMGRGTVYGNFINDAIAKGTGKRCLGRFMEDGEFENDQLKKGKKYHMSGMIEEGDFVNGNIIDGKTIWPEGHRFEGIYDKKGNMAKGTFEWADGSKFEGEYENGRRSGFGVFISSDGSVYEGQFKNDRWDGMGKLTLPDGTTQTGLFHDGIPSRDVVESSNLLETKKSVKESIFRELGPSGKVFKTLKRR